MSMGTTKQIIEQVNLQSNYQPSSIQGISNVKQVAIKGATGRKGSLPLNYQQPNLQNSNQVLDQVLNPNQITQGKGINKSIKSHAKYFSQQNSPVGKEKQIGFSHHHQQSLAVNGNNGIILSTSGAGIIGVDPSAHIATRILQNDMQHQQSHHTTGNFGSIPSQNMSMHGASEPRVIKNYQQLSQNSNSSNIRDYKQNKYLQLLNQESTQIKQLMPMNQTNSNKLPSQSHMKQVHSLGGPILSQYAGNQTIASGGNSQHSIKTQQTSQTFNASLSKHINNKQQYDDIYLNGPLNNTQNQDFMMSKVHAKRTLNNQSQQASINFDEQFRQDQILQAHHNRVISLQQQKQSQSTIQRSNTQNGNYGQINSNNITHLNKTDINQNQKKNIKQARVSQPQNKIQMEKSQELFQKSGNQMNLLNSNSIILNANGERIGIKSISKKTKAQTRPNSNQKNKQNQLQESFINDTLQQQYQRDIESQGQAISQSKKLKNVAQSAQTSINDRKSKTRYSDSQNQKRQSPQTINQNQIGKYNNIQSFFQPDRININGANNNMVVGSQNLVYYGVGNKIIQSPNDFHVHPSQGSISILQSNGPQQIPSNSNIINQQQMFELKKQQQVVTVPQTILHKSNKLMNNYLKQSTIQQQELQQSQNTLHNKRMSTDQAMNLTDKEQLSFSMKKQSFHQRAETQLKNPGNHNLLPFQQQYEMVLQENETIGSSIQGVGSQINSFMVMPQQHSNSLQSMINTQSNIMNNKKYKANDSNQQTNIKSQKSSTSRLINSSSTQGKYVQPAKATNQSISSSNQVQSSADRIPNSQRTDQQLNQGLVSLDSNILHQQSVNVNDMNYGGQKISMIQGSIANSNSNQFIKNQKISKLNTLQNTQYPYQSSSTKSNKNIITSQGKNNLSIAQIFQQKGLNYKGPSKVGINSNNVSKIAQRMGPNGIIVHTKGVGVKGSLTTSANTAQNSPRTMMSKQSMYIKNQNQQNNLGSLRKKPSTASIVSASIGPQSLGTLGQKSVKTSSSKINSQIQQSIINTNLRTTSNGGVFKKVSKYHKSGKNSVDDSPDMYQDEVQITEIAAFDDTEKINELEPSKLNNYRHNKINLLQEEMLHNLNQNYKILNNDDENINLLQNANNNQRQKSYNKNQFSQQIQNNIQMGKKNLLLGPSQQSSQYIADNGGTGSNPIQQSNQRVVSQHDFYSQNIAGGHISQQNIPQKKNQHSNSLGNIQQLEQLKSKHIVSSGVLSGPHPTPTIQQMENRLKQQRGSIVSKGNNFSEIVQGDNINEFNKFTLKNDEQEYQKQLHQIMMDDEFTVQGPLITEEEEQEIRQVASDINEKAFYGKVLRAKQIIQDKNTSHADSYFRNLSPRSQEIASVMKEIDVSFRKTGQPPETDINYYRVGKMLGRGAFGKVNLAMHKLVRKLVALKSLNKECLTDEVQKQKLMKEVNLLLKLRHDHVVKIYETIETKKHIIIVMELCAGGDLLNYVRKRRRLKEPFAKKIFKQIIEGLKYIHSKYVGHRDIKLDNILLDGKGSVKIADFGVSKQCQPGVKMREQCGTPAYIAPEILKNKNGYSYNVDFWSAGVVLFAMLYGTVPFKAASMEELHSLILRGVYTLKEDISQDARDLLRGLLEINPHKRLTINQILDHPWLSDYDENLQLFNDQEREMIKKEYTYNDPSRYNRNENEEPVDCFTEHNIDSVYNTFKNASEKSIILAPFNSTQSEDFEQFKVKIKPMMFEKNLVLRLSRLCREIDRQYEFNNNGQLDNGVYHKQINNTAENQSDESLSDGGKEKKKNDKKKKQVSDDEDDETRFQIIQCTKSNGIEFLTEDYVDKKLEKKESIKGKLLNNMKEEERRLLESTFGTNREMVIDQNNVGKLLQFGYPYSYVQESLQNNLPNYVTAGYYLLQMDQNYC